MSKQTDTRSIKSEVAKTKYRIIGLTAVFGLTVWMIDAALDRFFFYEGTFWELQKKTSRSYLTSLRNLAGRKAREKKELVWDLLL